MSPERSRREISTSRRVGHPAALALFLAVTGALYLVHPGLIWGEIVLAYTLLVSVVAIGFGTGPALISAGLSTLAIALLLPALLSPHLGLLTPDWPLIVMFVAVSAMISAQAGRLRTREALAQKSAERAQLLAELSEQNAKPEVFAEMRQNLAGAMLRVSGGRSIQFYGFIESELVLRACSPEEACLEQVPSHVADRFATWREGPYAAPDSGALPLWVSGVTGGEVLVPMVSSQGVEGVVRVDFGDEKDVSADVIEGVIAPGARIIASRIEADRLSAELLAEEVAHERESARDVLVSSVSHELKTPLAGIKAIVSSMLEGDIPSGGIETEQSLRAISVSVARLEANIEALLEITRLRSLDWRTREQESTLADVIGPAIDRLGLGARERIRFAVSDGGATIWCDEGQMSRALSHLLENALAYSDSESPVTVGADLGSEVRIWVEDQGLGISDSEKAAVLKAFHRGAAAGALAGGTGLGLTIANEIVMFHGGRVEIHDAHPYGSRVSLVIPVRSHTAHGLTSGGSDG